MGDVRRPVDAVRACKWVACSQAALTLNGKVTFNDVVCATWNAVQCFALSSVSKAASSRLFSLTSKLPSLRASAASLPSDSTARPLELLRPGLTHTDLIIKANKHLARRAVSKCGCEMRIMSSVQLKSYSPPERGRKRHLGFT